MLAALRRAASLRIRRVVASQSVVGRMLHFDALDLGSAYKPEQKLDASPWSFHADLFAAVIVPTLNEVDNIAPLLARLDAALAGWPVEIIFVDDWSQDGTAELITAVARTRSDVRLIRRYGRRGLASAALEGILATSADVVAVIDADMQHDERLLPRLLGLVGGGEADVAIGSRYAAGGSIGEWNASRARVSSLATRLATTALKLTRRSRGSEPPTDPLSGFFAVRRSAVIEALPSMSGKGFKILLDLLVASPAELRVREAPYQFRGRVAGESKLGAGVCLDYLVFLLTRVGPRLMPTRMLSFGAVGAAGLVVQLCLLKLLHSDLKLLFTTAQAMAVMVAIAFNFFANNAMTYRDRRLTGARLLPGLLSFYVVCGIGALANVAVASLVDVAYHQWWLAGAAGAVAGSVWNYGASSARTWRIG